MKVRFGFVTNSSCGNYVLAIDADEFLEKLKPLVDKYELRVIEVTGKSYVIIDAHTSMDNWEGLQIDYGHELFALRLQLLRELSDLKLNAGISEFRISESTSDYFIGQIDTHRERRLFETAEFTQDWREEVVKLDPWHQIVSNFKEIPLGKCPECGEEVRIASPADAPWPLWAYGEKVDLSPAIDQALQTAVQLLKDETLLISRLALHRFQAIRELWEKTYSKGRFLIQTSTQHRPRLCSLQVSASVIKGVLGDVKMVQTEPEKPHLQDCILYPGYCLLTRDGRIFMLTGGSDILPRVDGFLFNDIDPYDVQGSLSRFIFKAFSPETILPGNDKLDEIIRDLEAGGGVDPKRLIAEYIMLIMPLAKLGLSDRTSTGLQNKRVRFLGDVATHTEGELLSIKNFGKRRLMELRELLSSAGLSFGMKLTAEQHAVLEEARRLSENALLPKHGVILKKKSSE